MTAGRRLLNLQSIDTKRRKQDLRIMSAPAAHTAELVEFAAATWGDRRFICEEHTVLSFSDLLDHVRWSAAGLIERGATSGSRVAIWAPNRWEWIVVALATHYIGGTLVTLNTRYRGTEAAQILRLSGAQILITAGNFLGTDYPALLSGEDCGDLSTTIVLDAPGPDGFAALLQAGRAALSDPQSPVARAVATARARASADDLSDILFTSGTTGTPKGVMTTHRQNLKAFATFADLLGLDNSDRYLIINPLGICHVCRPTGFGQFGSLSDHQPVLPQLWIQGWVVGMPVSRRRSASHGRIRSRFTDRYHRGAANYLHARAANLVPLDPCAP